MRAQSESNPLGKLLGGALVVWVGWIMGRALGALSDPVTAVASGFLMFMGAALMFMGVLDLLGVVAVYIARRRAEKPTGIYGSAAFATPRDCANAGLTDPHGIFLGMLDGVPLFYSGKSHGILVAPARAGKGISFVVPNLLHYQGSMLVTDPKGELAAITGRHRAQKFGQKVVYLNPWGLHGLPQSRYNPLSVLIDLATDAVRRNELGDAARAIAGQLVPEPEGGDKNQFFRDGARNILEGLLLHMATRDAPERCTLPELWRVLKDSLIFEDTVADMCVSDVLGGTVAAYGEELRYLATKGERQFADFRTGASNALQVFQPGGPLADAVSGSDLSFDDLKDKRTTVYLMIPAEKIAHYGPWIALVVRQAINAVSASHKRGQVLFMLDEFANMGKLSGLAENLTLLAGHGVRIWTIVQDLMQLQKVYGRETMKIILSQSEVMQFFAVRDQELARQLSSLLGDRSIMTRNFNLGRAVFDDIGESISERGVPLMSPQEIRGMDENKQLLFVKSALPVLADKVPYWRVQPWKAWAGINPYEGGLPALMPGTDLKLRYSAKEPVP